jgi:hypothetical protein
MTDPFASPARGSFTPKDLNGRLLLITPHMVEKDITTDYGVSDAIRADVVVLDGDDAPDEKENVLIFQKALQGNLRGQLGKGKVLGRLGQGEAKKGQSAPWILADPTEADKVMARAYIASHQSDPFS